MKMHTLSTAIIVGLLFAGQHGCSRAVSPGTPTARSEEPTRTPASPDSSVTPAARLVAPQSRSEADLALAAIQRKQERLRTRGPKSMDKPAEAARFIMEQRFADATTPYPFEQVRAIRDEVRAREATLADLRGGGSGAGGVSSWISLGPGNIGGRTRAIVFDPTNPDIMYAAGVAGGVWKSIDAGANWNATDDMMLNLAVTTIAIDPQNTNILYAGTGEGFFNSVFVRGLGVFKSTDAGATWAQLSGTVSGVPNGAFDYVNKVVISPNDSNRIYAGTRFGVWRSLDAGQNWAVLLSNPNYLATSSNSNGSQAGCTDLVVRSDTNPDVLFAAFGVYDQDGLFRSDDGGDNWLVYTTGTNQGRMTLSLAPSNNDIMYLLMADNGSGGATGQLVSVFRSDDGGDSFVSTVDFSQEFSPWLLSNLVLATDCLPDRSTYSQGWYDNIVAVDPIDPDIVWVGGVDLFRSDDGGQTFGLTGYWFYYTIDPLPPEYSHPDNHIIAFHPDYDGVGNQIMYAGSDGGLFRTLNARAPTTLEECPFCLDPNDPNCSFGPGPQIAWESMNNGYGVTQFYHGDAAKDVDVFIGGAQDNGTNRVQAADTPNNWKLIFGGDGGSVAIDPTNSQTVYIEYHVFPSIQKSTDGGDTFVEAFDGITDTDGIFIPPFAMDQQRPENLWTGGSRVWRTQDNAASWQLVSNDFAGPGRISAIGISDSASRYVYLGYDNGYIVRTTNGLAVSPNWTIRGAASGLPIGAFISSVTVDPVDPETAYCTTSFFGIPQIYRTTNGGATWTSIDGIAAAGVPDIPVHWLAVRPCDSQQLYAATELGVFASDDGGGTWEPVNTGLANTKVESLDFKNNNALVAFTHGRGAFITLLLPCASCPGDANGDGQVDISDLGIVLSQFGMSGATLEGDLNGDDLVNVADLGILLADFGSSCL